MLRNAPDHRLKQARRFASRTADESLLYNCTGTDGATVMKVLPSSASMPLEFRLDCINEARRRGLDEVSALAKLDFQTYLVSILNRQDKMSMATSIEARVPFLDNEIIDFAHSLPLEYKQTTEASQAHAQGRGAALSAAGHRPPAQVGFRCAAAAVVRRVGPARAIARRVHRRSGIRVGGQGRA